MGGVASPNRFFGGFGDVPGQVIIGWSVFGGFPKSVVQGFWGRRLPQINQNGRIHQNAIDSSRRGRTSTTAIQKSEALIYLVQEAADSGRELQSIVVVEAMTVVPNPTVTGIQVKSPGPNYEEAFTELYPAGTEVKQVKTQLNSRRQFFLLGQVEKKQAGKNPYIGTALSKFLNARIGELSADKEDNKRLVLRLKWILSSSKISCGNSSDTDGGSTDKEPLSKYIEALDDLCKTILKALSVDGQVQDVSAARVYIVYLMSFFSSTETKEFKATSSVTNKVTALCEVFNQDEEDAAVNAVKDARKLSGVLVDAVFEGDDISLERMKDEAAKQYLFMLKSLPNDDCPRRYLVSAFSATPAEETVCKLEDQMNCCYLPQTSVHEMLFSCIEALKSYGHTDQALEFATKANKEYPAMGYELLLPGAIDSKLPSRVFKPEHICKNDAIKMALHLSQTDHLTQEVLSSPNICNEPSTYFEVAGAGKAISPNEIVISGYIDSGSFAKVYKASYKGMAVAVKAMALKASDVYKLFFRGLVCSARLGKDYAVCTLGYFVLNESALAKKESLHPDDVLHIVVLEELAQCTPSGFQRGRIREKNLANAGYKRKCREWNNIMMKRLEDYLLPFKQILEALIVAHKLNIEHRDINPDSNFHLHRAFLNLVALTPHNRKSLILLLK